MKFILSILLAILFAGQLFAGGYLKQSTATTINLGPFVKIADGSLEDSATITGISLSIIKQSTTLSSTVTTVSLAASGSDNDGVFVAKGTYNAELSTGNTDTVGRLEVRATYTGCYPVTDSFTVVASASWDSVIAGSVSTIDDFWEYATASITSGSGIGYQVKTNLNIPVSNVWNELLADHTTASTFGSQLSTTNLGAAVWASTIETNYTAKAIMRIISAALAGKLSGVNINAPVFRDVNDSKNRITMTTGSTGRSAVTLDATD